MQALEPPAPGACRIFLVRHGQTVMNTQVRFRGRRDVPLNDVGRSEAIAAGLALGNEGITAVYSSPLGRAREVGTAIATASGVPSVQDHADLVNVEYGEWEGLTSQECAERDPDAWSLYNDEPEKAACPGGEALADAGDRIVRALREIGARHPGESVAAVAHGIMLRLAVLRVAGQVTEDWQFSIPTGTALAFDVEGDSITFMSPTPAGRRNNVAAAETAAAR